MPAALPTSCEDVFAMARDKFEDLIRYLQSAASREVTHSDLERTLKDQGLELLRTLYQAHLDDRGPGAAASPVQGADGVEREQERLLRAWAVHPVRGSACAPDGLRRRGCGQSASA